ncbi:hypothetical protein N7507_004639 [Penicillium longicatenatum]|nr:hypothetical protein N7507_004639 [Penicillium longicatenatum]
MSAQSKTKGSSRRPLVPSNKLSPINILTVSSSFLTLAALIWAIMIKDGAAVLALIGMSAASTLVGFASHWSPQLASRPTDVPVPKGDIAIRTRDGAFIIVQCSEEIARELYIGPEECDYFVSDQWFRVLIGIGTLLVILSVLLLGNCNWTMQAVIAILYIILNALYWVASLFPERALWDLSRYDCQDVTPEHMRNAQTSTEGGSSPSFTRTLWFAIQATQAIEWVTISGAAPKTAEWEKWLKLAEVNCKNKDWDAIGEKNRLMGETSLKVGSLQLSEEAQGAPATLPVRKETA